MRTYPRKAEITLPMVPVYIMILVVLIIILGVGGSILSTMGQAQCTGSLSTVAAGSYLWNSSTQACMLVNSSGYIWSASTGPSAFNSSAQGLNGVSAFSGWVPTIFIVLASSIVIGLVVAYLMWKRSE